MDISALVHCSDSIYSFPINEDTIEIRLQAKKNDNIRRVELLYNDKYIFHEGVKALPIELKYSDSSHDYYIKRIKLTDLRFAYIFKIYDNDGNIYYFSESGVTKEYDITKGFYDFFQVSYINPIDIVKVNKKIQNRVFYQIFVDRFNKCENDSPRINLSWGDMVDRYSIAGGNLRGIANKLDYLENLGINALYLTPIFKSESNHKYDIIDYFKISEDFGDERDLRALIDECHKRDILVFLDGVFNHISDKNELFLDVVKNGKKSKYYSWFFIDGDNIDLDKINYETFAEVPEMPRLNLNNSDCQDYVISVGEYYASKFNIDGFRLDVSDEIPHKFWIRFKDSLLKINPSFALIGENWHNAQSFLNSGYEFDSIMNYGITKELLEWIAWDKKNALEFKDAVVEKLMRYKTNVNYNLFNLISSHDILRFLTECKGDENKLLLGYAFIFMHIGIPCIYYGDEIGIEGGFDPDSRRCFLWDSNSWNYKIRNIIRELIALHKIAKINELNYNIKAENELLYIERFNNNKKYTLIINKSDNECEINIKRVLISNLFKNNKLSTNGFVIIEEDNKL